MHCTDVPSLCRWLRRGGFGAVYVGRDKVIICPTHSSISFGEGALVVSIFF